MDVLLIAVWLVAFCGLWISIYAMRRRRRTQVGSDNPLDHIRGMYLLKIPYEKTAAGYFSLIILACLYTWITGSEQPLLDLSWLIISVIAFLLFLYKLGTTFIEVVRFKWTALLYTLLALLVSILIYSRIEFPASTLLRASEYLLTIHILGLVLGLGGTTILDIMIFHFLRNFKINQEEAVIMHLISQLIIIGLILLIVSGLGLFMSDMENYLHSGRFLMKMTIVLVVIINGGVLNLYITPKIEKISLKPKEKEKNQTLKKTAFAVGAISMLSWYASFFLAMVKDLESFDYMILLAAYLVLLFLSIGISQFSKVVLEKKVKELK